MTIDITNVAAPAIAGPGGWGLFPERESGKKPDLKTTFRYFFVEFNPLYFISAFCILYGVFLIARNMDALDSHFGGFGQGILFIVMQIYEALIIGGVAFLVHYARARRPAALLCVLESVLLFDCTFRLEGFALLGIFGACLTFSWLLLTCVKIWALGKAMRIKLTGTHYVSIVGTAAMIVGFIALSSQPHTNKLLVLQIAAWLGAFVLLALYVKRPQLSTLFAKTDQQRLQFNRCINAAFRIMAGFYFYHIWAYILFAADPTVTGAAILPQSAAVFLLYALLRERQSDTWCFGALTVGAAMSAPVAIPYAMCLVGAVFAYRVWKGGHSNLAVGATFAIYAGMWLLGWQGWGQQLPNLPAVISWETIGLCAVLGLIGFFLRNVAAMSILGLGTLYAIYTSTAQVLPTSELGRGVWIMGAGFVVFAIGIAINWWCRASPVPGITPESKELDATLLTPVR
jgi:hypothetical protein